jgi:hypothetical protein
MHFKACFFITAHQRQHTSNELRQLTGVTIATDGLRIALRAIPLLAKQALRKAAINFANSLLHAHQLVPTHDKLHDVEVAAQTTHWPAFCDLLLLAASHPRRRVHVPFHKMAATSSLRTALETC